MYLLAPAKSEAIFFLILSCPSVFWLAQIYREAMHGGGGGDEDFLNMLQVLAAITHRTDRTFKLTHGLHFLVQAAMQAQGRAVNADEIIGETELDEHSTTFIQSKDVDPSSTGENSQCRCPPLLYFFAPGAR